MKILLYFLTVFWGNICLSQKLTTLYLHDFPRGYKILLHKRELGESKIVDSFYCYKKITTRTLSNDRLYSYYITIRDYKPVFIPFVSEFQKIKIYFLPYPRNYNLRYAPENYKVIGGKENTAYSAFTKTENYWVNVLRNCFDKRDALDLKKDSLLYKIYEDSVYYYNIKRDDALYSFINKNRNVFASLDFYSREANRLPYIPRLANLFKSLSPTLQNTPEGIRVNMILFPKLKVGDPLVDICQPDTTGNISCLASLQGKIVLIDFWASWCGPCIDKFKILNPIYEKFKEKGFEVFAISVDESEQKWQRAIAKGNYSWINVSELIGQNTKAVLDYGVYKYPTNFLIDRNGNVLERDIEVSDLEKLLEEKLK